MKLKVFAMALLLLAAVSCAKADSTLHVGTGLGTMCQAGCMGDPNLIDAANFDLAQVSNGSNAGIASLFLVLAVPNGTANITINGSTGTAVGFDSTTDIYNFLSLHGYTAAGSLGVLGDKLGNLEGADSSKLGITATGYEIYVFSVGGIANGGYVGLSGSGVPLGTYAFGLGVEGNGNSAGTPFTEAGLNVPEPSSLMLLMVGMIALVGGMLLKTKA